MGTLSGAGAVTDALRGGRRGADIYEQEAVLFPETFFVVTVVFPGTYVD